MLTEKNDTKCDLFNLWHLQTQAVSHLKYEIPIGVGEFVGVQQTPDIYNRVMTNKSKQNKTKQMTLL
jgi:hypothetical protein